MTKRYTQSISGDNLSHESIFSIIIIQLYTYNSLLESSPCTRAVLFLLVFHRYEILIQIFLSRWTSRNRRLEIREVHRKTKCGITRLDTRAKMVRRALLILRSIPSSIRPIPSSFRPIPSSIRPIPSSINS